MPRLRRLSLSPREQQDQADRDISLPQGHRGLAVTGSMLQPFARCGFRSFTRNAGPLVQSIQPPPRLLPAHNFRRSDHTAFPWLDLAEGRLRLDRLAATAAQNFLPLGMPPIPREARKFRVAVLRCAAARKRVRRRSPPAQRSPSRPRWSRVRKQKGEVTWLTLALSRNPAPSSRAKSSP